MPSHMRMMLLQKLLMSMLLTSMFFELLIGNSTCQKYSEIKLIQTDDISPLQNTVFHMWILDNLLFEGSKING